MKGRKKFWLTIVAIALVFIIIAIIYFMVVRSKNEEKYNSKLALDIKNVLSAGRVYTFYESEEERPIKSKVEVGFDVDADYKVDHVKNISDRDPKDEFSFEVDRKGRREILLLIKKPRVLKHELEYSFDTSSLTESNEKKIRIQKEIEDKILSTNMFSSIEKNSELALKSLLEAYGYRKIEIRYY